MSREHLPDPVPLSGLTLIRPMPASTPEGRQAALAAAPGLVQAFTVAPAPAPEERMDHVPTFAPAPAPSFGGGR